MQDLPTQFTDEQMAAMVLFPRTERGAPEDRCGDAHFVPSASAHARRPRREAQAKIKDVAVKISRLFGDVDWDAHYAKLAQLQYTPHFDSIQGRRRSDANSTPARGMAPPKSDFHLPSPDLARSGWTAEDKELLRSTLQLLARVFLFLDYNLLRGQRTAATLPEMMAAAARALDTRVDGDWDQATTMLALLREVERRLAMMCLINAHADAVRRAAWLPDCLPASLLGGRCACDLRARTARLADRIRGHHSGDAAESAAGIAAPRRASARSDRPAARAQTALLDILLAELTAALRQLASSHETEWTQRRRRLQLCLEESKQQRETTEQEGKFLSRTLFYRKALSLLRSLEVPCRLQLPASIRPRAAVDAVAPPSNTGPVFYCGSVETFISEFLEYGLSLQEQPAVAAQVLASFVTLARERLAKSHLLAGEDVRARASAAPALDGVNMANDALRMHAQMQQGARHSSNDLALSEAEIEPAVELLEAYITARLFPFLFFSVSGKPASGPAAAATPQSIGAGEQLEINVEARGVAGWSRWRAWA